LARKWSRHTVASKLAGSISRLGTPFHQGTVSTVVLKQQPPHINRNQLEAVTNTRNRMDVSPQKSLLKPQAADSALSAVKNAEPPVTWFHRSKNRYKCTNSDDPFIHRGLSGVQCINTTAFVYVEIWIHPWFTLDGEMV
jgi:hypothetical protein